MNNASDRIRDHLRAIVAQRIDPISDPEILETILICDGMYCGRRFRLEGYSLIFFAEERQVKLYAPDGSLVRASSLEAFFQEPQSDSRRAA